jgi:hypothetical protein
MNTAAIAVRLCQYLRLPASSRIHLHAGSNGTGAFINPEFSQSVFHYHISKLSHYHILLRLTFAPQ